MGISCKSALPALLVAGLACGIGTAQAATVNFTLTGVVNVEADVGNDFGLSFGDTVTATGSFDDSALALAGGTGDISFGEGSGNTLDLNINLFMMFTAADDERYETGFPTLSFNTGSFVGLNFGALFGTNASFDSLNTFFDGYDNNGGLVSGTWTNYEAAVVPVPAAVWLLGSGLLGLAGVARRKQAV